MDRRTFYALGLSIAGTAVVGCVVAASYLGLAYASIAIPVIVALAGIVWTMLWGIYREPQRDASLLAQLTVILDARAANSAQLSSHRASGEGSFKATASVYAIPPVQEVRDHLRLERFLIEAPMPNEASRRNAETWLGVLRSQQPYLTARHPPETRQMLEKIWNEVKAESMRQLRGEVRAYLERKSLAHSEVPQPGQSQDSPAVPDLPDRSDSGLPRVVLRTTQELRITGGRTLPLGTEGLFVWLPPTTPTGMELVDVRIGDTTVTLPLDSVIAVSPPGHAEVWNKNRESILGLERPPTSIVANPAPIATQPPPSPIRAPNPEDTATHDAKTTQPDSRKPTETVLFDDTLEVEATGHAEIHASLKKGTRVLGFAREPSNQPFDFYIMDRKNYVQFCEDRGGNEIFAETDRVALEFKKTIPRDGIWYFVFDTYGKQTNREIRLELRTTDSD